MYAKINLAKLYEQYNTQAIDTDESNIEQKKTDNLALDKTSTGALHAFPITSANINSINQLINGKIKEWKSDTPLNIIGSDGTIGGTSMLEGLPVYLMIRIASKSERASKEIQLRLSDRIYVLLDTSNKELQGLLAEAGNKDDRIRISVKTPIGREHSVELWKENNVKESPESNTNITVDLNAQIENPGTAAGIEGVVTENKINNKYMKNSKINEQTAIDKSKISRIVNALWGAMKGAGTNLGIINNAFMEIKNADELNLIVAAWGKDKEGNGDLYQWILDEDFGNDKTTYNSVNSILKKKGLGGLPRWDVAKSSIKPGDKSKAILGTSKGAPNTTASLDVPFKDKASGDAFRTWANSTPELAKKYGKSSPYDLDASGKFNNSFIKKAYTAAKVEYDAYLASKNATKKDGVVTSKYKIGEVVYYKDDALINKEGVATIAKSEEKKVDAAKPDEKKDVYAINKQYGTGANPRAFEGITTRFSTFKSILEQDTSKEKTKEEMGAETGLIKDFNDGKIKKGVVVKEIDKDTIEVVNDKSDENEKVKIVNILDKTKVKEAAAKAKATQVETESKKEPNDTRTSSQKAEDKLADEKTETKDLRGELKSKREEKRAAKQNVRKRERAELKTNRQDKKQDRIKNRIDKQEKKIENIGESKVYTFADFIKSVNKLN